MASSGRGFDPQFRYPYQPADGREDPKAADDVYRVLRGGAFPDDEGGVRAADRGRGSPVSRFDYVGFRVVVSPFFSDL